MSTAVLLETAVPVATPTEALMNDVRALGIYMPRPVEVRGYMRQFPDIMPVVRQACDLTVAAFAGEATLSLEVYIDPEIDDPYLTLYVRKDGYDAATSQVLESIFETYSEGMIHCAGWMMVMPDYRGDAKDV